jgi:hypothetical protein
VYFRRDPYGQACLSVDFHLVGRFFHVYLIRAVPSRREYWKAAATLL